MTSAPHIPHHLPGRRASEANCYSLAFTIVELLVVIGVVGALMALLMPALASVTSASRSTRCQLNLRQMATAAHTYAAMFDSFPVALRYETGNRTVSWDYVAVGNQVVSPGALWNFTDNPGEVLQCPDYNGPANVGEEFTGYNYNTTYIGGESPFMTLGWSAVRPGIAPHACNRASKCAMFGDAGRKNGSNRYMRAPLRSEGPLVSWQAIYSGGQAFRHAGRTNVSFVDGHIGSANSPQQGQFATPNLLSQYLGFPLNGFLSNDDSAYDPR